MSKRKGIPSFDAPSHPQDYRSLVEYLEKVGYIVVKKKFSFQVLASPEDLTWEQFTDEDLKKIQKIIDSSTL